MPVDDLSHRIQEPLCAVTELFDFNAHAIQHRDIKIAQRYIALRLKMLAGLQSSTAVTAEQNRQIIRVMPIAIGNTGPEQNHAVIQKRAVAFRN